MKTCKICGQIKDLQDFPTQRAMKDGVRSICRDCYNAREAERANKRYKDEPEYREKIKARVKKGNDPEISKARARAYYYSTAKMARKAKRDSYKKEYNKGRVCPTCNRSMDGYDINTIYCSEKCRPSYIPPHPKTSRYPLLSKAEKRKAYWHDWYEKNKNRLIAQNKKARELPENRLMDIFRRRHRHMMRKGITTTMELLGLTYRDYEKHFREQNPIMWIEWCNGTSDLVIDHIIPVRVYDIYNEDDVIKCWNPRNLRIITRTENAVKSGKVYMDLVVGMDISDLLPTSISIANRAEAK